MSHIYQETFDRPLTITDVEEAISTAKNAYFEGYNFIAVTPTSDGYILVIGDDEFLFLQDDE